MGTGKSKILQERVSSNTERRVPLLEQCLVTNSNLCFSPVPNTMGTPNSSRAGQKSANFLVRGAGQGYISVQAVGRHLVYSPVRIRRSPPLVRFWIRQTPPPPSYSLVAVLKSERIYEAFLMLITPI